MAYPYKKMTSEDFDYIRSVTASDRVWVGDEIAKEYYRDEMPEYGVFPPELYVEVLNKEEISAIMAYAYKENIPVVCRGAGTGLAGGATCKYGGIMLSVMRMNKIFPIDRKNQTITAEPGALLIDIQAAAAAGGLFYPPDPGEKTASIGGNVITNAGGMKAVRYGLTRDFVRCIEAVMPDGSIMNFSSNVVKNTTGSEPVLQAGSYVFLILKDPMVLQVFFPQQQFQLLWQLLVLFSVCSVSEPYIRM